MLPPDHDDYFELLTELVRVDMELAWCAGRRHGAADYLARFPALDCEEGRQVLCFEEDRLRRIAKDEVTSAARRYLKNNASTAKGRPTEKVEPPAEARAAGEFFQELHDFDAQATTDFAEALTQFPQVGEHVLGFELVGELGRGAFSRVYLAREPEVGNRLVALKITGDSRLEVAALARLRHTNIAPVYSVRRHRPIEAVCMPYLGGTTLRTVIAGLGDAQPLPQSGRWLVECLHERDKKSPLLAQLSHLSYVDAVLELAARASSRDSLTPTSATSATGTSSRRTYCSRTMASPCSWIST